MCNPSVGCIRDFLLCSAPQPQIGLLILSPPPSFHSSSPARSIQALHTKCIWCYAGELLPWPMMWARNAAAEFSFAAFQYGLIQWFKNKTINLIIKIFTQFRFNESWVSTLITFKLLPCEMKLPVSPGWTFLSRGFMFIHSFSLSSHKV